METSSHVTALVLLSFALTAQAALWDHKKLGVDWITMGNCNGKSQSPIDFDFAKMTKATYDDFDFIGYDRAGTNDTLVNDAHCIMAHSNNNPLVQGGGLPGVYQFAQYHMHWGSDNKQGSEHTINGESYPMELHLVHYKLQYGNDIGSALKNAPGAKDSLAVLGIMFKLQDEDNKVLEPMMTAMDKIATTPMNEKVAMTPIPMADLLPKDTKNFFRYRGSLTTPGCFEVVVWTVFQEPIGISAKQMAKFRQNVKIKDNTENLVNNYRVTQPWNGRTVEKVSTKNVECASSAISHLITWSVLVISLAHILTL